MILLGLEILRVVRSRSCDIFDRQIFDRQTPFCEISFRIEVFVLVVQKGSLSGHGPFWQFFLRTWQKALLLSWSSGICIRL